VAENRRPPSDIATVINNKNYSVIKISPIDISVNLHIGILGLPVNKLLYAQKVP